MKGRDTDQCGSRDVASVEATAPLTPNLYAPWTAEWDDENADWHVMGAPYDAGDGVTGQPYICTLSDYGNGDIAHLIAAAPELLGVANILASLESEDGGRRFPTKEEVAKARAAIARATSTNPRSE